MIYLWIKVIHLLAVISWMAGLFYLPRLFVYHVLQKVGSDADVTFKTMESRLLRAIMRPAAVATLASGLLLILVGEIDLTQVWLLLKLAAVAALFGFHGFLEFYAARFASGRRGRSERYFRVVNEIPTVLLIVIVVAVVVRPFS